MNIKTLIIVCILLASLPILGVVGYKKYQDAITVTPEERALERKDYYKEIKQEVKSRLKKSQKLSHQIRELRTDIEDCRNRLPDNNPAKGKSLLYVTKTNEVLDAMQEDFRKVLGTKTAVKKLYKDRGVALEDFKLLAKRSAKELAEFYSKYQKHRAGVSKYKQYICVGVFSTDAKAPAK